MPSPTFEVVLADTARSDLYAIENYWVERGERWRGEKYFDDLAETARRELREPIIARRGRPVRNKHRPEAREILAFGAYRIIYEIDEAAQRVNVLRFWHAHRHEPGGEL